MSNESSSPQTPPTAPAAISDRQGLPQLIEAELLKEGSDILTDLPKEKRARMVQVIEAVSLSMRSGPLPAPAELAQYNSIIPNGADRIMKMAESQLNHRIDIEKKVIGSQQKQAILGQVFGFIIGIVGLSLATYAAIGGQPWFGGTIGGTTLIGLVSVFVYAHKKKAQDLSAKAQQMPAPKKPQRGT